MFPLVCVFSSDGGFLAHGARDGGPYPHSGAGGPTKVVGYPGDNNNSSSNNISTSTNTTATAALPANGIAPGSNGKTTDALYDLPCYNEYLVSANINFLNFNTRTHFPTHTHIDDVDTHI